MAKDESKILRNEGKIQKAESTEKSMNRRPESSLKQTLGRTSVGKNARSRTTESRYLGTLKMLDTKSSGNATFKFETADTVRASIYQVWLEKKKQVIHEQQRKQKLKEQQENERREQAFEKWKEEKDMHQMEKLKKQKEIEKQKKRKEKEEVTEKKKENVAALTKWNSNKKVALKQKMKENAKEEQKKKTEEAYTKYEREEMASTMYEKWLEQKEKQQRHDKKQRKIRRILQHSESPPPWSPPNKTIPFGK
ncbi:microtubule-associated protein 9-like [Rhincodon typus]|uniref:microtubule-associated protein 9-like n=1 Tax=Rhincodon typus TaxID=259920 RepID=UPI00202E7B29|nr:microtubule-associated protein 9-like [Rhincodon typus]